MTTEIAEYQAPTQALSVYGNDDPVAITRRVVAIAGPLADFIKQQHMSTRINDREYVLAEGWAFMGSMLGVFPNATRVSEVRDPEGALLGFEAHVELRTRDGALVGGAIAECSWSERNWHDRDPFALKSMAQTRATGKAYRMAFGFVMKAAGYEATPAEEMTAVVERPAPPRAARQEPLQGEVVPSSDGITTVGALLTWANTHHRMTRDEVLGVLGVEKPSDIKNLSDAVARIEAAVLEVAGAH